MFMAEQVMNISKMKEMIDDLSPKQKFIGLMGLGLCVWGGKMFYDYKNREDPDVTEEYFEDYFGLTVKNKKFKKQFKKWFKNLSEKRQDKVVDRLQLIINIIKKQGKLDED